MPLKRGYLLAEAIAALALAGVLAATAAVALGGARRALLGGERRDRAERAERESLAVLRDALEAGDLVELRGDTAVDLDVLALVSVVCAIEPRALVLPPAVVSEGVPLTTQAQAPDVNDVVSVLASDGADDAWWVTTVDSVRLFTSPGTCDSQQGWTAVGDDAAPRWRLHLRDSVPEALALGAPVRVGRAGRFTLYHAGRGEWMLGWRRCSPISGVCGVVQPVSGPLRPPSAGGLRFSLSLLPARLDILVTGADGGRSATATLHL
ncbi:MAG: hypothetical protein WD771_04595 [Gemmatimonadaceae bacterium]